MGTAVSRHALAGTNWPVLVSIPHAGRDCPAWVNDRARVGPSQLARLSDGWCDMIAAPLLARGATVVKANLLRAVADCNRNEGDMDPVDVEPAMRARFGPPGRKARAGLGVVPARLPGPGPLWTRPLQTDDFEARLALLHRPYHRLLADAAADLLCRHGTVLLIDLHSMPPLPPSRWGAQPPQIVVGDRFGRSAAPGLASLMLTAARPCAVHAAVNVPYAGGHIVEAHGRPATGVHAIQMEFDRRLYLDRDGFADADRVLIWGEWLVARADDALAWLSRDFAIAAE